MDKEQLLKMYAALKNNPGEIVKAAARHRLINFARYMQPDLTLEPFHVVYYTLLDKFAHGEIKKMIVQMPPQHEKRPKRRKTSPSRKKKPQNVQLHQKKKKWLKSKKNSLKSRNP